MSVTTDAMIDMTIGCIRCDRMLLPVDFDIHQQSGKRRNVCKKCRLQQINRWQEVNREQTRTNQQRYNRTFRGRAIILFNAAKARAKQRNESFAIELDQVIEMLSVGICAKTGVPFEYENSVGGTQSPYAPSIDRIDTSGIYEVGNVQIVCFWYNQAKQQWPEHVMVDLCKRVAERAE